MKKSYWNLTALAAAFSLAVCSCSSGNKTDKKNSAGNDSSPQISDNITTKERPVQTADEVLSNSFKASPISIPDGVDWFYGFTLIKDTKKIMAVGSSADGKSDIYRFNEDLSSCEVIEPELPPEFSTADNAYANYNIFSNGEFGSLITLMDFGGMKPPEEYDENFDYESAYANQKNSYIYCKYDQQGKLVSSTAVTGIDMYMDDYNNLNIASITEYQGKTLFCLMDSTILSLNSDGSLTELYSPADEDKDRIYGSCLIYDSDGKLVLMVRGSSGEDMSEATMLYYFDIDSSSVSDPIITIGGDGTIEIAGAITTGGGDYRLLVPKYDALFGLKADGSLEKILDWMDSDITASSVYYIGEDKYVAYGNENNETFFNLLTRRPMNEVENTQVITMASIYGVNGGDTHVSKFNRSQNKYRIKFVDYSQYNDENDYYGKGAMQQLQLDIVSGKAPDIIVTGDFNTIRSLSQKGAFTDLYEFMEKDSEVNRDTLMPNILKALESKDGSLYTLSPTYSISTLAAKTSVCNKENWTLDDMISLYDNAPETADHLYDYDTKEDKLKELLQASSDFVDYNKFTCRFDSDDFVKLLEFCNRFVTEIQRPDKETEYEALQQYYYDQFMAWSQDRSLIRAMPPSGYSYTRYVQARDEITMVGYPSDGGKGGKLSFETYYAISNTCPDKNGAWEFLRSYFSEEYQESDSTYGNPVLKSAFEKQMDSTMHLTDPMGNPVDSIEDDGAEYYPLTQKQRDMVAEYILGCDTIYGVMDSDIYDICMEEAGSYFTGECSAKEAADMIQNRVSILLSERS